MNTKLLKFAPASIVALVLASTLTACGGSGGDDPAARLRGDVAQAAEVTPAVQPSPTPLSLPTETPDLPAPAPTPQPIEQPLTLAIIPTIEPPPTPLPHPTPQAKTAYAMPAMPNVEPCPVVNGRIDSACAAHWRRP